MRLPALKVPKHNGTCYSIDAAEALDVVLRHDPARTCDETYGMFVVCGPTLILPLSFFVK